MGAKSGDRALKRSATGLVLARFPAGAKLGGSLKF
jgi:hypothetical protein